MINVHIGLPKCGSTSLQECLYSSYADRVVPKKTSNVLSYLTMSNVLKKNCVVDGEINIEKLGDPRLFDVLTHENFSGFIPYSVEGFRPEHIVKYRESVIRILSCNFEVNNVVVICRNPKNIIKSLYLQYVRQGFFLDFSAYCQKYFHAIIEMLNLNSIVDRFSRVYGSKNFNVLPMEKILRDRNGFLLDLGKLLNVELTDKFPLINSSLPPLVSEYLRITNILNFSLGQSEFLPVDRESIISTLQEVQKTIRALDHDSAREIESTLRENFQFFQQSFDSHIFDDLVGSVLENWVLVKGFEDCEGYF